ncbi:hypothetical protein ACP3TY_19360 [Pseudomonas rustica]|uniref:hypothetical protein n=1 Tax=Pseudomonas rustica TaxID=2827099 RepID=UPI003CEA58F8
MRVSGKRFIKMKIPVVLLLLSWAPLFVFAFFISDDARSGMFSLPRSIVDGYWLTGAGFISSRFYTLSSTVVNYIGWLSPFFSVLFTCLVVKNSLFEDAEYEESSLFKMMSLLAGWVLLMILVFWMLYMRETDLAHARAPLSLFGRNPIAYILFSCGVMFLLNVMVLSTYLLFRHLPVVIRHRLSKKNSPPLQ